MSASQSLLFLLMLPFYFVLLSITCFRLFLIKYVLKKRLRWSRGSVLAFSTQVRGFKPGRSTLSFGGEIKPSVPCGRFAACKCRGSRHFGKITGQHSRPQYHLPPLGSLTSWRTWRHLVAKMGTSKKAGESNGNLPLRTCPGCSVPELHQSPD